MHSTEVNELYEIVRSGEDINSKQMINKLFILDLFGASTECLESDLEALKFLLEVREAYRSSVYAKSYLMNVV